jgi:pantothenate kinase type III
MFMALTKTVIHFHSNRTVHITEDEVLDKDPFVVLSRYLSNAGLKLVFGETMQASKENAREAARLRPVHLLTIYFIANDTELVELIASLLKDIPCRLIRLHPNDFFSKEEGRYDTMGIDRLATLRCAGCTYGFPILVIDGGTCLTHTAADENGVIIGGGISSGFGAHVHSVTNRINSMTLKTEDLMAETAVMLSQQEALDPFPKSTMRAILTDIMASITYNCRRVIKEYLKRVGEPEGFEDDGTTPKSRHVVIIGGDEAILQTLLDSDAPYFPSDEVKPRYQIHCMKHAIALGLSFILQQQSELNHLKAKGKHGELMRLLLGKRVAKNFPDAKGNVQIFRGSITAVSDEPECSFLTMIKYDDDDVEELNPPDLYSKCD